MLQHNHRDILAKVIRIDDYVAWSNGKYGKKMSIARVIGTTSEKVVLVADEKIKRVYPENLLVITQQVQFNINNNVGSNA